jgi:hypothetical protein
VTEGTRGVLAALDHAMKAGRARSKLGTFYRENRDDLAAKLRAGVGWRAVSKVLVEHGLIEVSAAFTEEGEAGEKERDRVASLAKTAWQRAKGKATKSARVTPPAAAEPPVVPRVRPATPPGAPTTEPAGVSQLDRLDRTMKARR